jgi:four helix bundle protein
MVKIRSHRELEVYRLAFEAAMEIFETTKRFPREEVYSLTDQIRRSSRSVCANLAEAWRRRRYEGSFVYKLNGSEAEAAETQTWLEFAVKCGYLEAEAARPLYETYDRILGKLVVMIRQPGKWVIGDKAAGGQGEVTSWSLGPLVSMSPCHLD